MATAAGGGTTTGQKAVAARRTAAVVLLCAVVVGCAVWASDEWGDTTRRQVVAQLRERAQPQPGATAPPGNAGVPVAAAEYLPGKGSSGEIAVRVSRAKGDDWQVTARYRLRLRESDPLAGRLRATPSLFSRVSVLIPGGYGTLLAMQPAAKGAAYPVRCTVSQASARGNVTVTAAYSVTLADVVPGRQLSFQLSSRAPDSKGRPVPNPPGPWRWSLDAPPGWGFSAFGQPSLQTARTVEFALPQPRKKQAVVGAQFVRPAPPKKDTSPPVWQVRPGSSPEALLSLLALGAVTGGALTAFLTAPGGSAASPRRTRAAIAVTVTALLLAVGALLLHAYSAKWRVLFWLWGSVSYPHNALIPNTLPLESRTQGTLLGTVLFVLPVLAVTVTLHLRAGRFPRPGELCMLAAPAVALVLMAWLMGADGWTRAVLTCLATASLAAGAVYAALRLGLCGSGARPWATPLAVAAWTAVATSVVLQVLPWDFQWSPTDNAWTIDDRTVGVSWPLAFLLPVPWVTALLLLTCPLLPPLIRPGWRGRLALGAVFVTALLPWWTTLHKPQRPPTSDLFAQLAGQWPGDDFIYGVRTIAPGAQIMWCAAVVVLVAHLYATGTEPRRLGPGARRDCVTLLLFAAASTVIGAPDSWLPYWTTAAALFMAWAGAHLILPPARAEHAKRLHRLTGAAHARLLNSLARALLFAEGRHRFLTSSRGTLADTSLPADDWEDKWQSLRRPTAGDAADETARLKGVALGGSGGRTAWNNGLTAAAATALLTLPWTAWTAWQAQGYSGVPEAVTVAGAPTCVWLAHGFVYGYLYPWLRGNTPVGKAGWLWLVMSSVQVLLLVPRLRVPQGPVALSVFLLLAQSTVLALALALYWEIRLVRRADLLWGHIRNFRRLSSLATPLSAVLVATMAAVATVLATTWANNVTSPVENPSPSPSATSSAPEHP
ncbi:hypothetical protein [Streptomyces flavofungini]|uniref:Integral membrane protein n=1 Tax=Streptomyces flavofungini TaxID=68200 RepID=A0ABS0XEY0_9ACTN|nr:hypothetical protein [Streptomyces flavofungini]MBJ3811781.1 hypothetical protein [Streptomyces flavofungini]GHC87350.1 hypothetical protein GCM10010349_74050 [Streptomyces flavofungini]